MLIVNTLAPVFLLIAVGAVMQRTGFVTAGFLREANRVTYWLGLPALLFSQLTSSVHSAGGATLMLLVMLGATGLVIVSGYLVGVALRVPGGALGTFVQAVSRGNLAFVGFCRSFIRCPTRCWRADCRRARRRSSQSRR